MAHYAQLDKNNIVVNVFVGKDENDLPDGIDSWEEYYAVEGFTIKRTSYNTYAGKHLLGGEPFRVNYAQIGFTYDEQRDAFIPPKPYESWILNEETCLWEAPVDRPDDGKPRIWDEKSGSWVEVS